MTDEIRDEKGASVRIAAPVFEAGAEDDVIVETPFVNETLVANGTVVPDIDEVAKRDPYVMKKDSAQYNRNMKRPPSDWEKAIEKIQANAAAHGGYYIAADKATGEPFLDPLTQQPYEVNTLLKRVRDMQIAGYGMDVPGAGLNGEKNHFFFKAGAENAIPLPPQPEQQPVEPVKTTTEEKDKGGVWAWLKRNWLWLLAGAGAIAGGIIYLVHKNRKKSVSYVALEDTPAIEKPSGGNVPDLGDIDIDYGQHNGPYTPDAGPDIEHPFEPASASTSNTVSTESPLTSSLSSAGNGVSQSNAEDGISQLGNSR